MKLFLTGGFLGSGKTTAIQQACTVLRGQQTTVGVITNDQGMRLVDSAFLKGFQIPAREVTGGCFCCNYTQLDKGIRSLHQKHHPAVIFAESVGSCTDIVATVIKPLERSYPDLEVAFSVFADALVLLRHVKGAPAFFDDDVNYIYEKQLEEADLLVINKIDLLTADERMTLAGRIETMFPGVQALYQNSLDPGDIRLWLTALKEFVPTDGRRSLEMDYDRYGTGEAKLAWLDHEWRILSREGGAVEAATALINRIYGKIREKGLSLGHLKFLMKAGEWQRKISFTTVFEPALRQSYYPVETSELTLLINARVQTTPGMLDAIVGEAVGEVTGRRKCQISPAVSAAFQPGYPRPLHRIME
jgi:Ni2+-binding GTPase involved in maturation of urease and hydrogenase